MAPPELWILNKKHHHNAWVMAQFGGAELPFYTFNINTAQRADLETLHGMDSKDAGRIVMFRDSAGYFRTTGDIRSIRGVGPVSVASMTTTMLDPADPVLTSAMNAISAGGFITSLVVHLLIVAMILAIVISGIQYFMVKSQAHKMVRGVTLLARNFFKAWMFLLVCITPFLFNVEPLLALVVFAAVLFAFNLFRTATKPEKRREVLISTLIMSLYFSYSLV
jgi:uncharacterized protein YjeT (DUF2065 family)